MLCWQALGIAPTTDFGVIERAYRAMASRPARWTDVPGVIRLLREYDNAIEKANLARSGCETFKSADLARRILATWQQGGDQALLAWWPTLRGTLGNFRRPDWDYASRALAHLVLLHRALPVRFVDALRVYFAWDCGRARGLFLSFEDTAELQQRMAGIARQVMALDLAGDGACGGKLAQ